MRNRLTLLLLLLFTFSARAQAPGEDRAMGWLAAFNGGNAGQMEAFVQQNYTAEALARRTQDERRAVYERLWTAHGKLEAVAVSTLRDGLEIEVVPERGSRLTFRFDIEPAAPHRIHGVGIEAGADGERGPRLEPIAIDKNMPREKLAAAVDHYVRELAARDAFSGAVLIARNGEVLFESAYGHASRRWSIPNKVTTRFNAGSITKRMTKIAIAQLVQAGKIRLDAPLATYLPDYPNKEIAQKITIQQIVDHRSGLGDIFIPRFWQSNTMRLRTPRDFIDFFANEPLAFEPGMGERYSNYGYVVLGAVIEAVSGESYYDYIQKNVFDAAGMRNSGFFLFRKPIVDVAIGHTKNLPDGRKGEEWLEARPEFHRGIPAGLSLHPVRDLLLFDRAARAGKLVNEAGTRWYFGGSPDAGDIYAGGLPGSNAGIASDGTWTVIVMANIDPPAAEGLAEHLYRALK